MRNGIIVRKVDNDTVEKCIPYIEKLARKENNYEETYSDLALYLCEICAKYPDKDINYIKNRVACYYLRYTKRNNSSKDLLILPVVEESNVVDMNLVELKIDLELILKSLDSCHRDLLCRRANGETYSEIAMDYGMDKYEVRRLEARITREIRRQHRRFMK